MNPNVTKNYRTAYSTDDMSSKITIGIHSFFIDNKTINTSYKVWSESKMEDTKLLQYKNIWVYRSAATT